MGIRHVVRTRRAHVLVRTVGCTALPLSGTGGSSARWLALQSSSTGGPHALAPLEGVCGEFYPSMNGSRRRYPADASAGGARMELPAEREPHHGRSSSPRRHPGDARPASPRRHPGDAPPARSNMHVALLGHILAVQWCIGTCNYVMFTTYIWPRKIKTKCRRYASQSWSACRAAPAAQRCPRRPVAHAGKKQRAW